MVYIIIIGNREHKEKKKYSRRLNFHLKYQRKDWRIPIELKQFSKFLLKSWTYERGVNPDYDKMYAYISVDQRPFDLYSSQRRWWRGEVIRSQRHILFTFAASGLLKFLYSYSSGHWFIFLKCRYTCVLIELGNILSRMPI